MRGCRTLTSTDQRVCDAVQICTCWNVGVRMSESEYMRREDVIVSMCVGLRKYLSDDLGYESIMRSMIVDVRTK